MGKSTSLKPAHILPEWRLHFRLLRCSQRTLIGAYQGPLRGPLHVGYDPILKSRGQRVSLTLASLSIPSPSAGNRRQRRRCNRRSRIVSKSVAWHKHHGVQNLEAERSSSLAWAVEEQARFSELRCGAPYRPTCSRESPAGDNASTPAPADPLESSYHGSTLRISSQRKNLRTACL